MTPALSSIMRNKRVQFLPVQWRTSLALNAEQAKEREDNGLDNDYSLAGIEVFTILSHAPTDMQILQ